MNRNFLLRVATLSGLLAVMLGAFGAHGLRSVLDEKTMHAYETAVLYHFIHTLVLVAMSMASDQQESVYFRRAAGLFIAGAVCFSGSLYAIAFTRAAGMDMSWLGPVTPVGGILFMAGWLMLLLHAIRKP